MHFTESTTTSSRQFVSGWLLICLIKWFSQDEPSISLGIATGLSIAAAYLTKLGNLPLIVVAVGAILWWCITETQAGRLRRAMPALGALAVCAATPIVAWLVWMKTHFGDFTGATSKAQLLGWTTKPFSDWWSHPIFTAPGMWTFLSELIVSFWRGEFMWHAQTMGYKGLDLFMCCRRLTDFGGCHFTLAPARQKHRASAASRAGSQRVCDHDDHVPGLLSLQFDFGRCINRPRAALLFQAASCSGR
jgi:hypothetical protein